ncbi:MAG TPA: DNA-binding protein [Candidatus Faecousia intestinigallinarum]|nr:DNA-binding protein [Candidatus Faecousia intestinigallinarum]
MESTELILLYDYYGEMLTPRQRQCFELRYHQDFSLGEIAQELRVSRQGVYDNLNRAEALLRNMEAKTGFVRREMQCRQAARVVIAAGEKLEKHPEEAVRALAREILSAARELEE